MTSPPKNSPGDQPSDGSGFWPLVSEVPRVGLGARFYLAHLVTIFGLALSNAFLGLTLLWSLAFRSRLRRPLWTWGRVGTAQVLVPLTLYLLFYLVSSFASYDRAISIAEWPGLISLATLPLAIWLVWGEGETRRAISVLIALVGLLAVYGLAQYAFTEYGTLYRRIPGPFSHYMTFSGVLLLGLCLVVARLSSRGGRRDPWCWIVLVLVLVTLGLTLTRSAWVAAVVVLGLALALRARRLLVVYLLVLLITGVATSRMAPEFWERAESIVDLRDPSNYDRLCMIQAGATMITERPLYGLGPGLVAERYPIYRHPTAPRLHVKHLHNVLVHMAAERGTLSVLAYLWLMFGSLLVAVRLFRREGGWRGPRADIYVATILAIVGLNVAGVFEANWRDTEVQRLMLFILAMPLCASTLDSSAESPD